MLPTNYDAQTLARRRRRAALFSHTSSLAASAETKAWLFSLVLTFSNLLMCRTNNSCPLLPRRERRVPVPPPECERSFMGAGFKPAPAPAPAVVLVFEPLLLAANDLRRPPLLLLEAAAAGPPPVVLRDVRRLTLLLRFDDGA